MRLSYDGQEYEYPTCGTMDDGWDLQWYLAVISALLLMLYLAKRVNRVDFQSNVAQIVAGLIQMFTLCCHTRRRAEPLALNYKWPEDDPLAQGEPVKGGVVAAVPHKLGPAEAFAMVAHMQGPPPIFIATDMFFKIPMFGPLIRLFFSLFEVVTVPADKKDKVDKPSVVDIGVKALTEDKRVTLFPQGNFCRSTQRPHRIFNGAALMAIRAKKPIYVVRLDGYWCFTNPMMGAWLTDSTIFRAFLSLLHANNIQPRVARVVDYHLLQSNKSMDEKSLMREINAQIYAYARHTGELRPDQLAKIEGEIASGRHLDIWDKRVIESNAKRTLEKATVDERSSAEMAHKAAVSGTEAVELASNSTMGFT